MEMLTYICTNYNGDGKELVYGMRSRLKTT